MVSNGVVAEVFTQQLSTPQFFAASSMCVATMVATGVFKGTEKEMMAMINDAADAFILKEGIDPEKLQVKE